MKRETEEWIKIAEEDLQSAEYLLEKSLFRMACYHAQQSVEKVLKAVLTEEEIEFSRTHNILDLASAVKQTGHESPLAAEDAVFLNSVYRARYPTALGLLPTGEPTQEDAERASHSAREMRRWLKEILPC